MATTEDYHAQTEHEIKDLSTAEENMYTSERTRLVGNERRAIKCRWRHQRCCLTSKAALLILLWNLILVAGLQSFLDPSYFINFFVQGDKLSIIITSGSIYSGLAFLYLFYPLAGCLADIRWGRYKTVVNSLRVIWGSLVVMAVLVSVAVASVMVPVSLMQDDTYPNIIQTIMLVLIGVVMGIPTFIALLLNLCGLVSFSANVIQYGTDLLHDAPMEDSILYIHWYVWTSYAGLLPMKLGFSISGSIFFLYSTCFLLLPLVLLGATLCIQRYKRHWFLIDSGSRNPYKLVYKVLKFAKNHTNPIRRSAFTYCEDELPSRLDLGKERYGGPFTTEQVEDVKAFLGILYILLTLGPIMMIDFSESGLLLKFSNHLDHPVIIDDMDVKPSIVNNLTPLLITLLLPLYLCLLRPFIHNYIPGMLKRIGLGMILILLSILCTSAMDAYGHIHANVTACFLNEDLDCDPYTSQCIYPTLNINHNFLTIQYSLNAVGCMLLYIAVYEFICAQSPHAMKGLVIGTFFAIKGVFQLLGVVITYVPLGFGWKIVRIFPSCGFVYYLINAIIVFIGIVAYTCVARQYQYRERDEPDNTYRYAEEYYANAQDEPNYDYDDYDSLNVHTIN